MIAGTSFPMSPVLALYLPQGIELPKTDRRVIAHFPTVDIVGTLEIALRLVPGAKRVYVFGGTHEVDRRVEDQARRISRKWEGRLEFIYLSHMTFEDMLATISGRCPRLHCPGPGLQQGCYREKLHNPGGSRAAEPDLPRSRSSGSSTSPRDTGLPGAVSSARAYRCEGRPDWLLDFLGGAKTPDNIPAVLDVPPVPMFDWRQLRRWNMSEDDLPQGSIVINREVTFWDYKYHILGFLVFCILEAALIVILVIQMEKTDYRECPAGEQGTTGPGDVSSGNGDLDHEHGHTLRLGDGQTAGAVPDSPRTRS